MKIVIKIGTSTLTHSTGRTNIRRVADLCRVISDLKNAGHEIILVSSGAIAMGVGKLNLSTRPSDAPTKQAAAAVGQCELMYIYDRLFAEHNHTVAQLLITAPDIDDPVRKENFHNTLERLLAFRVLPIINENDTVSTEELGIGDNDTLSATVAASVNADLLVLLSVFSKGKSATQQEIATARRAMRAVSGSQIEQSILDQLNGKDGYVAVMLDMITKDLHAEDDTPPRENKKSDRAFRLEDFV